ncbi:MAG: 3-hydroxyacyl-CoA dehydrogenase NAD-binding domain-containing protein [Rhodospirillaceae bacterium]|nr:3-hydroxyacyl-CoA dehydrogenase NAD-binding domain-containing protein [Rhodospirillaceae bacterium]
MTNKPTIAAIGAGRMGRGIGHVFAYAGYPVSIVDYKPRSSSDFADMEREIRGEIADNMRFLSGLGLMTEMQVGKALDLISVVRADEADGVISGAGFLLEGVPETRKAKQDALSRMSRAARPDAIIASTTSTMLVTELQEWVVNPERFLNAHFLNPAFLIPLVEVSPGPTTDEASAQRLIDLLEGAGKSPVRCAASPGYIVPRLQSLIMAECCRMVAEGVGTPKEIDQAIMAGFGPRYTAMGVIEFIDWGGVDIFYHAGNYLAEKLNSERHRPPREVAKMMRDGRRGMRDGQGYYDFRNMDVEAFQQEKMQRFVTLLNGLGRVPKPGV